MIDLKKILVDLQGNPVPRQDGELTLGEAIANILITTHSSDPMRWHLLAKKLYVETSIELNKSDLDFIKNAVKETKSYVTLITGQVLEMLEEQK